MRLIPRRKRTWLLAALALLVVAGVAVWWVATAKSEFERQFDNLKMMEIVSPHLVEIQEIKSISTPPLQEEICIFPKRMPTDDFRQKPPSPVENSASCQI